MSRWRGEKSGLDVRTTGQWRGVRCGASRQMQTRELRHAFWEVQMLWTERAMKKRRPPRSPSTGTNHVTQTQHHTARNPAPTHPHVRPCKATHNLSGPAPHRASRSQQRINESGLTQTGISTTVRCNARCIYTGGAGVCSHPCTYDIFL